MITFDQARRNAATIAVLIVTLFGSTSALAGRATGLPNYQDSAAAVSPALAAVPPPPRLSSAERIAKLENEILMLRICLKDMAKVGTFRCVL